jgi:hypothetical protein
MRKELYKALLVATVTCAVPKVIDLLSQLTLYLLQHPVQ